MNCRLFAAVAAAIIGTTGPAAAEFVPAIIFDAGGKFDKSFNEAAYNGAERFKAESGIAYREFEIPKISQRVEIIRNIARRGAAVIVAVGFSQAPAVGEVAREFPDTKFTLIDAVVDLPNVQSVIFKEHEGSFLVGMAAALASKTGKIGFIGGMDTPLIRKFWLGYTEGAKYINPGTTVVLHMVGTTPAAWNNPAEGGELANRQFDLEVDVIYAAAGGHRHRCLLSSEGQGQTGHWSGCESELSVPRHNADLDDQACGCGRARRLHVGEERHMEIWHRCARPQGGWRWLRPR